MSATIRSLVIPVSDVAAAKAIYSALLGSPHTDEPYYVGYNVDGFEVALNPKIRRAGRSPLPTSRTSTRRAKRCLPPERSSEAPRARSLPKQGFAFSLTPTATRSVCADASEAAGA